MKGRSDAGEQVPDACMFRQWRGRRSRACLIENTQSLQFLVLVVIRLHMVFDRLILSSVYKTTSLSKIPAFFQQTLHYVDLLASCSQSSLALPEFPNRATEDRGPTCASNKHLNINSSIYKTTPRSTTTRPEDSLLHCIQILLVHHGAYQENRIDNHLGYQTSRAKHRAKAHSSLG